MFENQSQAVKAQYELWPYPKVPLLARIHRDSLWQINLNWILARLGQEPSSSPKIWIAGCGAFQPYPFSQANPRASILATDLSEASLSQARTRCRFHGLKNIDFEFTDLNDFQSYPEGPFDFIECYGVLMSLADPGRVLAEFRKRLKPNGVLRIMVYTHYGRQRIFQIQKLAKLLGLGPYELRHPRILQNFMSKLPENHPLKSTFFDYPDAKNAPGIVDGFLHASDRGFTGFEISKLLDQAGFEYGFTFHRPWGVPQIMEEKLALGKCSPSFWLHYLDLWQSLKSNFILCAVPKGNFPVSKSSFLGKHPLFDLREKVGLRHKARLLKLSILGASLQTRTHEQSLEISGREMRNLLRGKVNTSAIQEILAPSSEKARNFFDRKEAGYSPSDPWKVSLGKTPNPIYRHLFDAYTFHKELNRRSIEFSGIEEQWEKWKPLHRPLEDETIPWGLTPGVTFEKNRTAILDWMKTEKDQKHFAISEVYLKEEESKILDLKNFLAKTQGIQIPQCPTDLRVLWILLMSHEQLFLEFEWRPIGNSCEPFSSTEHLTDIINFSCRPLYKDRCFLHQKYVLEGLSIAQISSQIFSSKAAVRENLVRFGIPLREAHRPHGRPAQPKFGQKIRDGKAVTHKAEKKVIEAVLEMRGQKLSLRQIARFLTKIGVPTKRRGVSWHPQMVKRLLSSIEQDKDETLS